jgi:hypothetical protein
MEKTEISSSFSVIAKTVLTAVDGKKTKDCFTSERYTYRSRDFDCLIQEDQPEAGACAIMTLCPAKNEWTLAEAAIFVLSADNVVGIDANTDSDILGALLVKHGHTMTLPQIEEMIEATEQGNKTEMRTDWPQNFFFVDTGNEDNPVSIGSVRRRKRWSASVFVFENDDGGDLFDTDRLLIRNLKDDQRPE